MNILLIEPDILLAKHYIRSLSGHEVVHSVSAQDAISQIDRQRPDMIVLELMLGEHNGVEFLYELRSYSDVQDIPIVLNTYTTPQQFTSDEALLHSFGIQEYLYKPEVSLAQFRRSVERVLQNNKIT